LAVPLVSDHDIEASKPVDDLDIAEQRVPHGTRERPVPGIVAVGVEDGKEGRAD